jgi:Na+/melibiose symporter-like transporter
VSAFIGAVALVFFILRERRANPPLLDLKLFRIPAFTLGNTARWFSFITMSISNLLMPFFLQLVMQLDPLRTGILVAPTAVAMALLAPVTGWMSEKFAPERLCAIGLTVNAGALVYLGVLHPESSVVDLVCALALLGVGMGIFQTPNNNLLMSSVPRQRLGIGSSVLSIVRSLGYSLGATLATVIVIRELRLATGATSLENLAANAGGAESAVLQAFLRGYQQAFFVAAAIALAGAVISLCSASRDSSE